MIEPKSIEKGIGKLINLSLIGFFVVILMFGAFYTIDQTETGLIIRFGEIVQSNISAGLHFKIPLIDQITKYKITQINKDFIENDAMIVLTSDGLNANIDVSVIFRIKNANDIYRNIGKDYDSWLIAKVRSVARGSVAQYSAEALYTSARGALENSILTELSERVEEYFIIEDVLIRDVDLPESVKLAIESKMGMQQEAKRMEYELEKARIEAQKVIVEANATAAGIILVRDSLTDDYLIYLQIIEIARSDNSKIYVLDQDVPLILGD